MAFVGGTRLVVMGKHLVPSKKLPVYGGVQDAQEVGPGGNACCNLLAVHRILPGHDLRRPCT
eukprot:16446328-Heterocapsa_arctica.AAC.1